MAGPADLDSEIMAAFPVRFDLPVPPSCPIEDASAAIKHEYRISVRKKRLRCLEWERVSDRDEGSIYALKVGRTVEFDWTWEGAIAYRPGASMDDLSVEESDEEEMYWCGEVVEVDETSGRIFVSIENPDQEPTTGTFYVRPFEFLGLLNEVYNSQKFVDLRNLLPARLGATEGGIYPRLDAPISQGVPSLQPMWDHAWGILWGPPGTGKTYSIGQQVARCLDDPTERILVVSTTNKAVDGAAIQVGKACRSLGSPACSEGRILRVGKGVHLKNFHEEGLDDLIRGAEADLLRQVAELKEMRAAEKLPENRASLLVEIKEILKLVKDVSRHAFLATDVDVVVSTAFRASTMLWSPEYREMIEQGQAPFTTIIIDEAGLISRAATAVLSLLASRRVILAGDPKQLAPISRMSRVLPTTQARWLASSGLSHLHDVHQHDEGMHLLRTQYRMRPEISEVVSHYQYGGELRTADEVNHREFEVPKLLRDQPRAIWYVIDEDKGEFAQVRAERGPCNRSWVRRKTRDVLEKFLGDPQVRASRGLFISPFVAQAKDIAAMFAERGHASWTASTVHSQQGAEADIVIFDTVNASSTSWPIHEWLRLVNVGLSRAREHVVLIASRSEMQSPFLKPLLRSLRPAVLNRVGSAWKWAEVSANAEYAVPEPIATNPDLLGSQITGRKAMRPVLSYDQQRLCGFEMDGKPRLVRGVAGSGKTVVLGHWLRKTLDRIEGNPSAKIWAVFANQALKHLLHETIETAWREDKGDQPFPWHRVELWHVREVLDLLLREVGKNMWTFKYEYDQAAEAYLAAMNGREIKPRCHALFADEGQDLGPNTLKLMTALVEHGDPEHPNSRSVNIFYDNAQNIYNRSTPKWSEMGLDMRGRSTVMKESFRATRPITEFAFNVLHRLCPDETKSPDHKELVEMGLVELGEREGNPWWNVRFTQIDGPSPTFKKCLNKEAEFAAVGNQLIRWIRDEGVKPSDICIIYMQKYTKYKLETQVKAMLADIGVDLQVLKGEATPPDGKTVIATTPHSFKGYDAEIVVIPSVEFFQADGKPLTQALYVAMTRARSLLAIYGKASRKEGEREIVEAIETCLDALEARPAVEVVIPESDEFEDVLLSIGPEYKGWLGALRATHRLVQEPLLAGDRTILCEPLFWYESDSRRYACFPRGKPSQRIKNDLEDAGVTILVPTKKD
jgi:superfamily I DNA/RNA helicase